MSKPGAGAGTRGGAVGVRAGGRTGRIGPNTPMGEVYRMRGGFTRFTGNRSVRMAGRPRGRGI